MTGMTANALWGGPRIEPRLAELFADPIVRAVMRCDGVSLASLQSVIARVQPWLRQAGPAEPSGRNSARADIAFREILQRVEDALLEAGRREIAVATDHGTFEWRTNATAERP
jgi:ethanolamine utilization protein EutP (predicted NTPase)